MTGYLIDTNVLSEIGRKAPHPALASWYQAADISQLYLSVLTVGEVRRGVERVRPRNAVKAERLEAWLEETLRGYERRILPVDREIAVTWGELSADRTRPVVDTLLAATAIARGLTLVTRNTKDLEGLEVPLLNPFHGKQS